MNFKDLTPQELKHVSNLMFNPLGSKYDLKEWIRFYFGLDYPDTIAFEGNNSNPLDAIWQIYNAFLKNDGEVPGAIWLSARECLKTVSVAILEIILMLHFKLEIAHASATESQSHVCLRYIDNFLTKIKPLMDEMGWVSSVQNKRTFEFKTPTGESPFIKVVVCTPKGMNSLHANLLCVDELDLADPAALDEGRNIVGHSRGRHGFTLVLSTRKYAGGNMADIIERKDDMHYELLKWNILDVTEKCGPDRHKPELPKQDRYVHESLPLRQIAPEEFVLLPEAEKGKWNLLKDVHGGCLTCPLLPICKTKLSQLPDSAADGFYKPIKAVIQKFRENSPEIAEAQLLCLKPGSDGLVYPRFSADKKEGNIISLKQAIGELEGFAVPENVDALTLMQSLRSHDIPVYAGVDWGFVHDFVIIIVAKLPNGEIWVIDTFASPGLEFPEILETAISYRDNYQIIKWYCDGAAPSNIASFNKNGMKSPKFTKDIVGGINAVRSKIITATGKRLFKVIDTPNNQKLVRAVRKHLFIIDGQGNPTAKPDDEQGVADICDALRYIGQNLFPVKGPQKPEFQVAEEIRSRTAGHVANQDIMRNEISKRLIGTGTVGSATGKKGGFFWNI